MTRVHTRIGPKSQKRSCVRRGREKLGELTGPSSAASAHERQGQVRPARTSESSSTFKVQSRQGWGWPSWWTSSAASGRLACEGWSLDPRRGGYPAAPVRAGRRSFSFSGRRRSQTRSVWSRATTMRRHMCDHPLHHHATLSATQSRWKEPSRKRRLALRLVPHSAQYVRISDGPQRAA